jgi:hypothetical protein
VSQLSPPGRRHSLKLRLNYIEEKIVSVQEELFNLEQEVSRCRPALSEHG